MSYPVAREPDQLSQTRRPSRSNPGSQRVRNASSGTSTTSKAAYAGTSETARSARLRSDQNGIARYPSPFNGAGNPSSSRMPQNAPMLRGFRVEGRCVGSAHAHVVMVLDPGAERTVCRVPGSAVRGEETQGVYGARSMTTALRHWVTRRPSPDLTHLSRTGLWTCPEGPAGCRRRPRQRPAVLPERR